MKKTPKKVTLQTLDKKIDGWGQSLDTKIDTLTLTVDGLAISTNKGFDEVKAGAREFKKEMTEFKEDMTDFSKKTGVTLFNLDSHARTTNERLDAIEKTLEPLMFASGAMQRELREHDRRLSHVERKVGVVNN